MALPVAAGAEFAQPGAIEGKVTVAPGKAPIEGAEVCASASVEGEWFTQCANTKANGTYEVTGLPEAIYRVRFSKGESGKNLVAEYWRNTTNPNAAKLISISERQTVENINAELQPKAVGGSKPKKGQKGKKNQQGKKGPKQGRG